MPDAPNLQRTRTLQETITTLSVPEVLTATKVFFARRNGVYCAFPEQESDTHVTLRGQGGEEIAVAATPIDGGTRVTASTYLFDQQVARLLSTFPTPPAGAARSSGAAAGAVAGTATTAPRSVG